MHIAHLSTVHGRHDTRIYHKICKTLATEGFRVTFLVADGLGDAWNDGITILDVGNPANRLARVSVMTVRMWLRALALKPDILHFHDPELIPGGLLTRLLTRQPVVYDIHEYYRLHLRQAAEIPSWLSSCLARIYGLTERCAAQVLDACVVVSQHMQQVLPLSRSIVLENHARLNEFTPGTLAQSERPADLCYVGVLASERQIEIMVDAAAIANLHLNLAGRWYPEIYRQRVMNRQGWSIARELGQLDRQAVQELFANCRAGLLLLDLHGDEEQSSCNKLFEYMAAGLPVIATDLVFTRNVIERHHCGLLISRRHDSRELAGAMQWIIDHPDEAEQMGRAGRKAVEQHYSWEPMSHRLLELYQSIARQ